MFGPGGRELLGHMPFEGAYKLRVESLRDLVEVFTREVAMVEARSATSCVTTTATGLSRSCTGSGP
jgi:hypothetical protein